MKLGLRGLLGLAAVLPLCVVSVTELTSQTTVAQTIQDDRERGFQLFQQGIQQIRTSQYFDAIQSFEESIVIFRTVGDRQNESNSLGNLGGAYWSLGDYPRAIDLYEQSLMIDREIGNRRGEASVLGNLGIAYTLLGDYPKAIEFHEQSLTIARLIGNQQIEANALGNLGIVYASLGEYTQAIEFHEQHLIITMEIGDRQSQVFSLGNLGNTYYLLGNYSEAIKFLEQCLTIARGIGDRRSEASSLANLGNTYHFLGNYPEAIKFLEQSLTITRGIGDRVGEANSLGNLGIAHGSLSNYPKAIELFQQALTLARVLQARESERSFLSNIGAVLELQNQPELAIAFYKQSVNVTEDIRRNLQGLSPDLQQSYIDTVAHTYRQLADLLLSQGRILEAQQVLELLKIQEVRDFTFERNAGGPRSQITLLDVEQDLVDRHNTLIDFGQQLTDCEATNCPNLPQLRNQRDQLASAYNQAIRTLETEIRARLATDDAILDPRDISRQAREIVSAQPGTILIYPLVLEDKLWLIWAAEGRIVGRREIPVSQQELGETVIQFRTLLEDPTSDINTLKTTAQQLYTWLIDPITAELEASNAQHLVFSLDRATRYIPLAALHDGEQYLIERYTIATILSADLTNTETRLPANPDQSSILALGVTTPISGFAALPNVSTELDTIVKEADPNDAGLYPGMQLLDSDFTYTSLRDNLGDRNLLHIATHGEFVPGNRFDSFLLLGDGSRLPIPEIEVLGDYLDNVHMVVLSACQTALGGPDTEGLEIPGLSYYFLNGGAETVMASLWQVSDVGTSVLMQAFYDQLATGEWTKAEALQRAQLQLLAVGLEGDEEVEARGLSVVQNEAERDLASNDSHPYYWAPFVLIGNSL